MHWLYLALAIAFEVAGTAAMKLSDGFRKPGWALAMFVAYTVCFALVTLAIRRIELGVAYAVWAGVGTAVVAVLGVAVFGEPVTALKVAGVLLIVLGVVALNLGGVTR
ncbi:MAG TPA: multidrug efflux SMR transporter [Rubricoccaceae bacterium]